MSLQHRISLFASGALCALITGVAQAQTADSTSTSESTVAEIVVTGQRAADRNAIQTKRTTVQVVDAISADDIGQMADFSAGDALKRIAGVSVYTYQGEPRFASIRGFNAHYLTTTLDGIQIASPDNQNQTNGGGRQFYLESLPSNIASRIEVFKTSTPDMDGHSIGGAINFALPSAFDFRHDQLNVSGKIGVELQDKKSGGNRPTGQAEIFATKRFGKDDQFGAALSVSYWRREMWLPQVERGSSAYWYAANGANSGQPYVGTGPAPTERRWYDYDNTRERRSLLGTFDWRASDKLRLKWTSYYFGQNEKSLRNDMIASIASTAVVSNQTATSGTFSPRATAAADVSQNVRSFKLLFDRKIYGTQGQINYNLADKLNLDVRVGLSRATYSNPQVSDNFVQNGLSFNYVTADDGVAFTPVNSAAYNNLAAYVGGTGASNPQHYDERYKTDGRHSEVKAKLAYNMDPRDEGWGLEIGGGAIRTDHGENYAQTYQTGMPYTLADVISTSRLCALKCNEGGMYVIDQGRLAAMRDRYLSTVPATFNTASYYNRAFTVREDLYSGYLTGRWSAGAWSARAGVRYEATDFSTTGFRAVTRKVGSANVVSYDPVTAASDYGHWLPSALAAYDLSPDMRLRFAYSRTLGRPKYTDMGLLGGALNVTNPALPTLTTGNPNLKPRTSDNLDFVYEWYLDGGQGMVTLALFNKRIQHEIYQFGQTAMIDLGDGTSASGVLTSPINSDKTATVNGVEFNLVKYFDFLPGPLRHLGMNLNGVATDTKFPIRLADGTEKTLDVLPGQPRWVTNLALFYEADRYHARIAWNHTAEMIEERYVGNGTTSLANFYRIRWTKPADTVDASASYDVSPTLSVRVDATNLTGQGVDTNIGLDQEIPVARTKVPTALMFGVSAKF